jgi:hypothetical protein
MLLTNLQMQKPTIALLASAYKISVTVFTGFRINGIGSMQGEIEGNWSAQIFRLAIISLDMGAYWLPRHLGDRTSYLRSQRMKQNQIPESFVRRIWSSHWCKISGPAVARKLLGISAIYINVAWF